MNDKKYESLINFRRKDVSRLSYAIRQFNEKINKLEGLEKEFAPDLLKYSDLKNRITTRREFNRVINSLKRFTREGQEDIIKLDSGENISKWESHELNLAIKRATKTLNIEYMKEVQNPVNVFGMKSDRISQIEATLKSIDEIEKSRGNIFQKLKERIFKLGTSDKELKRAKIFKENYINALSDKQFKTFKNYKLFMSYINKNLKNPLKFYEFINKSESLSNLFFWYDSNEGIITFGGFLSNEDAFNTGLQELGILK